jgi:hypothetical protein
VKDSAFLPMMFVVQFLTWVGMFMLWIFTLPQVANLIGNGEALGSSAAIRWTGFADPIGHSDERADCSSSSSSEAVKIIRGASIALRITFLSAKT